MNDPVPGNSSRLRQFLSLKDGGVVLLLSRGLLLLAVLAAVKAGELCRLREHLFHSHWRLLMHDVGWFEAIAFGIFATLLLASFVRLGSKAEKLPVRTIRQLNIGFVVVGLLFWFFTRYTAEFNYLYPLLMGWHTPGDVLSKVVLDIFFAPPFLIFYLLLYPLLYWILVRTKREYWSLPCLGIISTAYFVLNQLHMVEYGHELTVLDCFGLAGLISLTRNERPLDGRWVILPAILAALGWAIFLPYGEALSSPTPYFFRFTLFSIVLALAVWFSARRNAAFPALSHLLPFYLLTFYLLGNQHHPFAQNYNFLAAWGMALPGYLLGEMVVVVLMLGIFSLLYLVAGKRTLWAFDVLALVLIVLSLVDFSLTTLMEIRLDWASVTVVDSPKMIWRMAEPYFGRLLAGTVALVGLYAGGIWWLKRFLPARLPVLADAGRRTPGFVACALVLVAVTAPLYVFSDKAHGMAVGNIVATSPMVKGWQVKRFEQAEFLKMSRDLGLPDYQKAPAKPTQPPRDLNLFLIVMESSYNRYLSMFGAPDETQPELKRYRDRLELFPNFYSNFPNSFHARYTVLSGFYATTEYASYLNPRIPAKSIFEILGDRGYKNTLFDSCFTEYARFRDYVGHRQLVHLYDFNNMPGREKFEHVSWGLNEACTAEAIKQQFTEHAQKKEHFCCVYLPVAPHYPFDSNSEQFRKFDVKDVILKKDFAGPYKNQLLMIDWLITGMIDKLKELGQLDNTLVVITNDHGEMLGDVNGLLGHGWNLEPYLTNNPLIIMDPARTQYAVNYTPGSQIDVLPTILDLLHVPVPSNELYEGVSLYNTNLARPDRPIFLTSHRHRAVVQDGRYYLEDPQRPRGADLPQMREYTIHNEDTKTVYKSDKPQRDISALMDEFERFQKSFIVHYGSYRKTVNRGESEGGK